MDRTEITQKIADITARSVSEAEGKLPQVLNELARRTAVINKTETYSGSVEEGDVPADFLYETAVLDVNDNPYPKLTFDEYQMNAYRGYAIHAGQPVEGDRNIKIYVRPKTETLRLYYVASKHTSVDTIAFPDAFEEAICYGAAWKVLEAVTDIERAERFRQLYESEIRLLKADFPPNRNTTAGIDSRLR